MQTDKTLSIHQVRWACLHKCGLFTARRSQGIRLLVHQDDDRWTTNMEQEAVFCWRLTRHTPEWTVKKHEHPRPRQPVSRPSDEIYFVFRYTNRLLCNVSWYSYVVRLLMTSVIITREFSKIKVTVNRAQSPRRTTICRLRQTHIFNTRSSSSVCP